MHAVCTSKALQARLKMIASSDELLRWHAHCVFNQPVSIATCQLRLNMLARVQFVGRGLGTVPCNPGNEPYNAILAPAMQSVASLHL